MVFVLADRAIESVGESLESAIDPILMRNVYKQGGRTLIRIGDADVDYDENFRLFMTTKLANPHFLPEISIKVSIINFTVTLKGLEDQLLGDVVKKERPDVEKRKNTLVISMAGDKKQLKEIEDKILKLLSDSTGNILDDEGLVAALGSSKTTSAIIKERVAESEKTEDEINTLRDSYRPMAVREAFSTLSLLISLPWIPCMLTR